MRTDIHITLDFRDDTPEGKDPDSYSKTLRRYHKLLWSKRLPSGEIFELDDTQRGIYLHHRSSLGEFWLSSDAVVPTFSRTALAREAIPKEQLDRFYAKGYTIGGMIIFPGNQVDRKQSLNQARGCHPRIRDRFDLTLECIRRHYIRDQSPLSDVLARYQNFFNLFRDFRGYAEFFLLQDLVSDDFFAVKFSAPFDNFKGSPVPATVAEYHGYESASMAFINARNQRIAHSA